MNSMFFSAMLLTGANLALRMGGMGFQVYLSGQIGAAGIGLVQLTLSLNTLAVTAGMAGVRTAAMYLAADRIGRGSCSGTSGVLHVCLCYSILCSSGAAALLYLLAPMLAQGWIGDGRCTTALRIAAAFLPVICLTGVMTGIFTAAGRVRELVAVELAEQLCSIAVTVILLRHYGLGDAGKAVSCVIGGSSAASLVSLSALALLYRNGGSQASEGRSIWRKLLGTAVPLALADDMRMGISTLENMIVPRRLRLYSGSPEPLADYGQVSGMVFPVLMFPACILFSLAELMIPELSRCAAADRRVRIRYLTERSQRTALIYGLACGVVLFTVSEPLGLVLYSSAKAGRLLRSFSILAPMLYLDAVTDAAIKGMGQQLACVRYNTLTSIIDAAGLWLLLPFWGLRGYCISFAVSHGLNFVLSICRLYRVTGVHLPCWTALRGILAAVLAGAACVHISCTVSWAAVLALGIFSLCCFFFFGWVLRIFGKEDIKWLLGLVHPIDIRQR